MDYIFTPFELLKGKAMAPGTPSIHKDGSTWIKQASGKWVKKAESKTPERQQSDSWRKAQQHFDYAMTSSLGHVLDEVMGEEGLNSFEELTDRIEGGKRELASEIYRKVVDRLRTADGPLGWKKDLSDNVGRALIGLRDNFSTATKTKLTYTQTNPKTGGKRRAPKTGEGPVDAKLPTLKASALSTAKKKLGGWSVTGPINSKHIKAMITAKSAKLVSGKIDGRRPWTMPKKAEDIGFKYQGDHLLLTLRQKPGKAKHRALAKVEVKLPYAYAKSYLINQVKSVRTRNRIIFRMERSEGYRRFLKKAGANNG